MSVQEILRVDPLVHVLELFDDVSAVESISEHVTDEPTTCTRIERIPRSRYGVHVFGHRTLENSLAPNPSNGIGGLEGLAARRKQPRIPFPSFKDDVEVEVLQIWQREAEFLDVLLFSVRRERTCGHRGPNIVDEAVFGPVSTAGGGVHLFHF
jgi:hypothetical protein